MSRSDPWPAGTPCWADIGVPDLDEARAFYAAVAGWEIPPGMPEWGGYTLATHDGAAAAGLGPLMAEGQPVAWTLYLASDDVDRTAEQIVAAGGTVVLPPDQVGSFGRMCIAADPTGAVFGVWQAGEMVGFDAPGEVGGWVWCDLRSTDPAAAQDFYASVFGYVYTPLEMAGPDYRVFSLTGEAGGELGGMGSMMGAPEGTPSHWLVYVAVADLDTALAEVASRGGTSLAEPFDSPYGRMGPILDPWGAPIWLMQAA